MMMGNVYIKKIMPKGKIGFLKVSESLIVGTTVSKSNFWRKDFIVKVSLFV